MLMGVPQGSLQAQESEPSGLPGSSEAALLQEARTSLAAGDREAAVELLRPLASQSSPSYEVSLLYGQALLQSQRASVAMWPLERAASQPEADLGAKVLFVTSLLHGGSDKEAIREATAVLEAHPEAHAVRRLRARAYEAALDREKAVEDLDVLMAALPADVRVREARLNLLIDLKRFDEAREAIEDLRALMRKKGLKPSAQAIFCASAARFERDRGEPGVAREALRECLERFPGSPDVVFSLVEILDEEGAEEQATRELEAAATAHPGSFRIQHGLSRRLTELGRVEEAEDVLLRAAANGSGAGPWLALADLRVSREDVIGSTEAIDRGLRAETGSAPGDPDFSWSGISSAGLFAFGDVFVRAHEFERVNEIVSLLQSEEEAYALLLEARMRLEKGDPAAALETYDEAFRSWPANPGARYLAGQAAMAVGEFDRAAAHYQDSLRSDAAATDAGLILARMQMAQGVPGAAMETLGFYARSNPDDPHAMRLYGSAAVQAELYEHAESAHARLASRRDWAGIALADQATDLARVVSLEEARRYLESSSELESPSHFEALSSWVEIVSAMGETERARSRVEALVQAQPGAAGYRIVQARILRREGRPTAALEAIREAVALEPESRAAQLEHGAILAEEGGVDEAVAAYDRATALDPLDPEAAFRAATLLRDTGRIEEARDRLAGLLERHPWHGGAALVLARLELERDPASEQALILSRQAARFSRAAGPESFELLARVLLDREEPEEAVVALDRARRKGLLTATARYRLALALMAVGDEKAARRELRAALQAPDFEERKAARAHLEALDGSEATSG